MMIFIIKLGVLPAYADIILLWILINKCPISLKIKKIEIKY